MQINGLIVRGKILDEEDGCGAPAVWPKEKFDEQAVLCGGCGYELRIGEYLYCKSVFPEYLAGFNPGCGFHLGLYFGV